MSDLKTYFAAPGRAETPSAAEAGDLAVRFPWFLPGRILRETLTGESDPRVALTAPWRAESSLRRAVVDASEELDEIYLPQGLRDKSVAIYRKLSLRNPEKSVYFAELIGKLENNN